MTTCRASVRLGDDLTIFDESLFLICIVILFVTIWEASFLLSDIHHVIEFGRPIQVMIAGDDIYITH